MSSILTPEELERVGLAGATAGERETIRLPGNDVAEAAGLRETGVTLALVASLARPDALYSRQPSLDAGHLGLRHASPRFLGVGSAALEAAGLRLSYLQDNRCILRVACKSTGAALRIEALDPSEQAGIIPSDDAGTRYVMTDMVRRFVAFGGSGTVAFEVSGPEITAQVMLRPVALLPPATLTSGVRDWCAAARDPWLAAEIDRTLAFQSPWKNGLAVGLFARLVQPPPELRKAAVANVAAGRPDPILTRPRAWARALIEHERRTLESLALADVDRLRLALETFRAPFDAEDAGWVEDWRELCERRDDLEAVRALLAEAGAAARLDDELAALDREGRAVAFDTPVGKVERNERLRRAARLDPHAWWTAGDDEVNG